jgi:GDP-L-fucose synthase
VKVLVTGGSGFLGRRLAKVKPDWTYVSSKDYNLLDEQDCQRMFSEVKPDAVLHLAGRVGGIKDNAENQGEFFYKNTKINCNVVHAAKEAGIQRLLASLSTCAFPDKCNTYPMTEEVFFRGEPAETNFSYGYTKRMLHVQCLAYRKQYGLNYSTFCPSNLYGPEDHFDSERSHFVPALVKKLHDASDGDSLEFWGTGWPLRQQLYVDDLATLIPKLLEDHNSELPLIVAPPENLMIKEMVKLGVDITNKKLEYSFNDKITGQFRKDGSSAKLMEMYPDLSFTSFKEGFKKTYDWYEKESVNNRN